MRRHLGPLPLRSVFLYFFFAFVGFFCACDTLLAQTTEVTVDIPAGIIAVEGKTSPHAQVKIYENSNDLPAMSLTADTVGNFSGELPQDNVGIVTVSIQATDTEGRKSELVSRQVAVLAHQTSTLTIILPPTITVSPDVVIFQEGIINFSGQTLPGATVEITIEELPTVLTTTSDSEGNYVIPLLVKSLPSAGIYTYGIKAMIGPELSDYVIAGTFVVSPPSSIAVQQPPSIIDRFIDQTIPAPEITFPSGVEHTGAEPFVISGRAEAGALITLHDDGVEIGAVIAAENGSWQFYFSPYKELHSLYATACKEGRCSDNSRTITIRPGQLAACRPGIRLDAYRLTATTKKPADLIGSLPEGSTGSIYLAWGDGTDERFDINPKGKVNASHAYQEAGTYSGYVIVSNGNSCHGTVHFAIEVVDPHQSVSILLTAGIAIFVVIIARLIILHAAASLK